MKRLVTAREQAELAGFWHTAADEDAPKKIYRGIRVTNFPEELLDRFRELQRLPMEESEVGQHLQIGPMVLDHLTNTPWKPFTNTPDDLQYTGLGRHWTRRRDFAETAASNQIGPGISVILEADDPGDQYYDPDIPMTGKRPDGTGWEEEEEATLLPDTPLNVTSIRMPGWSAEEVLDDPYYHNMEQEYGHPYPGGPRPGIGGVARDPFAKKAWRQAASDPYATASDTKPSSSLVYHLTDTPDFSPDPEKRPAEGLHWAQDPDTTPRGLYVTTVPNYWLSWGARPYIAEFEVPDDLLKKFPPSRNYPEHLIPPEHFGDLKLKRMLPTPGLLREGESPGFSDPEYAMEQDFMTGEKFKDRRTPNGFTLDEDREARKALWQKNYGTGPYRHPTDARDMTPQQRRKYERWYKRYWDTAWKEEDDYYDDPFAKKAATDDDWYRQAARIAAQAAELEWRHSLDGGPEWELIANPPTGQTQVIQTEDSRHQHYGVRNARVFSGGGGLQGDDPIADQKEHWRTQVMLPGMNRIPHTPGPFTGPLHSVPQGEDPEAAAFGLSHPQPSLPGMEVVQPADDVVRDLKRTPSEGAAPYGDRLERALYDEFMDWWPTSTAYATRTNDEGGPDQWVTTGWMHHPDEPITHWMNVEDFLKERYPEAATGSHYGLEDADQVMGYLDRWDRPDPPTEEEMRGMGYTSLGNVYTQAMLNLHNKLQGRNWASDNDRDRYMRLMLKHLGPQKAARLARLAASSFSCPPGQPGCVSAMGNPLKVEMPESKAPTAADYAEPWDANQTPADYSNSSYYIDRSGVGYPSSGGGTGGGGSWGGGGGSPDADNILPSSRALYDQLMQDYPGADIGGYRVDSYGEHARGALDFMTSDPAQAAEIRQKAFDAGAPYVLWQQRQWNADGTSSPMENRGDPTQNHYDHVHIAPIGG